MTDRPMTRLLGIAVAALLAWGCSDMRSIAGIDRKVPDEFAVVSRAPLSMPPSFDLPPPTPGAPRPQEGTSDTRAETALFGATSISGFFFEGQLDSSNPASAGEAALLDSAGSGAAQSNIGLVVNREAAQEIEEASGFADDLLFWQTPLPPGVAVDPNAESRRLANNAALGLPLNAGEVPTIEQRQLAPLEGLFGN